MQTFSYTKSIYNRASRGEIPSSAGIKPCIRGIRPIRPANPESSEESSELTPEQLQEARRIADELVKIYKAGGVSGPDYPETRFYAQINPQVWRQCQSQDRRT